MTPEFAKQALTHISKSHFGAEWPETAIRYVLDDLSTLPDSAMIAATKRVCMEFPPRLLPAIGKVVEVVKQESAKIFATQGARVEEHWSKVKDKRGEETVLSRNPSSKFMEHAQKAVLVMMSDKSREEKLDVFRVMERSYPGLGYAQEGARLQQHWQLSDKGGNDV